MAQPPQHYTIVDHLSELRTRIILCLVLVCLCAIGAFNVYAILFDIAIRPSKGIIDSLYVYSPEMAFVVRVKTSLVVGGLCALPCIVYQACAFMRPGLKANERYVLAGGACVMVVFYCIGIVFSYYCVVPVALRFLMTYSNGVAEPIIALDAYMRFVAGVLCASGILFLLSPAMVMLDRLHIVSRAMVQRNRGIVLVAIVILAAVITPPDVITQCMIAGPLYVLFEVTLLVMMRK